MKTTRKITAWLLTLALALTLAPPLGGSARAAWDGEGDGTSENPYKIGTAEQLKAFRDIVNGENGETQNTGACAVLTADIDLNNEAWTPIGNTTSKYTGIFDGNGKTISGLFINDPDGSFQGLFGYVDAAGKVREVGVVSGSVTGKSVVGSVVGWNYGTVENCYSKINATAKNYVGGVVGQNADNGTVENCYNTGSVSASDYSDAATPTVGGVVGRNFQATVNLCYNTGNITSTGFNAAAGGVVGQSTSSGKVQNCYNTGNVNGTGANYFIGGVVGKSVSSTISDCYNVGSVSASSSSVSTLLIDAAGGVAGYIDKSIIQNCYNTGGVSGTSVGSPARIGGVVGCFFSATLTDCYYLAGTASTGIGDNNATATELGATQLTDKTSFAGFDFSNNWYMGANGPELWAFASQVSTWDELNDALNVGGGIVLDADVTAGSTDTALTVPSGVTATLDLNGHTVDRGYGNNTEPGFDGSVIKIYGTLTLTDSDSAAGGAITGGFPDQYGGGVYINGGTFHLQGGSITGNSAGENAFFGKEGLGGGVYMHSGAFHMSGGKITGNKALGSSMGRSLGRGGGVYVSSGIFTFTGGSISGNEAGKYGGGVYIASTDSGHDGKINVSGGATVTDNTVSGADSNVYLEGGVITVTDALTGTIGVTMQTPGVFTSGLSGRGTAENFTSDDTSYGVALSGTEAALLPREVTPAAVFAATGYDTGTLSNVSAGIVVYSVGSDTVPRAVVVGEPLSLTGLAPCTLSVVRPGNGTTTTDSVPQSITVTRAAAPSLVPTQPAAYGETGGIPTTAAHELSTDGVNWTPCTGETAGLAPGTYFVRVKAAGTALTSDAQSITITAVPTYAVTVNGGTVTGGVYHVADDTVTVTVIVPSGKQFDKWTSEDGVTFADATASTTTFTMPAQAVTVTANFKNAPTPRPSSGGSSYTAAPFSQSLPASLTFGGGSVKVSPTYTVAGSMVTLTAVPDEGQRLASLTVKRVSGGGIVELTDKGDGVYTFKMPDGRIEIEASFEAVSAAPTLTTAELLTRYPDLTPGTWYLDSVRYVVERGIMRGTDKGFEPNVATTQGMMEQILYNIDGNELVPAAEGEVWWRAADRWAEANSVTDGIAAHDPAAPATREADVLMMFNYAKAKGYDTTARADLSRFSDADSVSAEAREAMAWAVAVGIINGTQNGTSVVVLDPQGSATRAQIAAIIERFCENVAK